MVFSVQKINRFQSVDYVPDSIQIHVEDTAFGAFLTPWNLPIQVRHMIEVMRRVFREQHQMRVPITENQL